MRPFELLLTREHRSGLHPLSDTKQSEAFSSSFEIFILQPPINRKIEQNYAHSTSLLHAFALRQLGRAARRLVGGVRLALSIDQNVGLARRELLRQIVGRRDARIVEVAPLVEAAGGDAFEAACPRARASTLNLRLEVRLGRVVAAAEAAHVVRDGDEIVGHLLVIGVGQLVR